ncbi:MAG: TIGR04372 family glycosyltransferase [Pseudomonadota bacterium]
MTTPTGQADFEKAAAIAEIRRRKRKSLHNRLRLWARRLRNRVLRVLYWLPGTWAERRGWRFPVITNPHRIGHLVIEPDCYVRWGILGDVESGRPILLLPPGRVANRAFVEVLRQRFTVIENAFLRALLSPFTLDPRLSTDLLAVVDPEQMELNFHAVLSRWGDRGSPWTLPSKFEADGRAVLEEMGLPKDAWFVCIHSREGGYSPADEYLHAHRNSDIASYSEAIRRIAKRGGWCIRVGDSTMKPMPELPQAIDYVHSRWKSDWMDVFLGTRCRFFVGNTSGLCYISSIFDVPSVLANMVPLSVCFGAHPDDISIPKLHRKRGEILGFDQIFQSDLSELRLTEQLYSAGVDVIDNTPEEIADAVEEMMDRFDGIERDPSDAPRQAAFRKFMPRNQLTAGSDAKIAAAFLAKYQHLLPPPDA